MDDMDWRRWGRIHRFGNIKVGWVLFVGRWEELGHVVVVVDGVDVVVDATKRSRCAIADIWMMMMDCGWKFCGGELNSWIRWRQGC